MHLTRMGARVQEQNNLAQDRNYLSRPALNLRTQKARREMAAMAAEAKRAEAPSMTIPLVM